MQLDRLPSFGPALATSAENSASHRAHKQSHQKKNGNNVKAKGRRDGTPDCQHCQAA